jgi:putative transposase
MDQCWAIFVNNLKRTVEKYEFQTHSFTLMSNHFHWLVSTPQANIACGMRYFMTETSRGIARASGRINKIFGTRYKGTLVGDPFYYANTFRYFYQNPIRAGICKSVADYPWSTYYRPEAIELFSCNLGELVPSNPNDALLWLNTVPAAPYEECMRKALRRTNFEFPRLPSGKGRYSGSEFL